MLQSLPLSLYFVLVGLIVGSYLNVVIHRLPRGISTVLPPSACPRCRARIRALDNIPVVSYLLLRGRCRGCGAPISWRYPVVEASTGLLFLMSYRHFGLQWDTLVALLFCCVLVVLAMIDFEHYILPDRLTLPGIVVGLGGSFWVSWTTWFWALVAAILGAGVLLAMAGAWYLLRKEEGMGLGDVKMLAMIGAFLGLQGMIISLFVAALAGALTGIVLMARGHLDRRGKLPFGSFLSLGALVALFFGEAMMASYTRLL